MFTVTHATLGQHYNILLHTVRFNYIVLTSKEFKSESSACMFNITVIMILLTKIIILATRLKFDE